VRGASRRYPLVGYGRLLRLVLDHAASVDEAVELIGRYGWLHASGGHVMVAEAMAYCRRWRWTERWSPPAPSCSI
jgi:hypothetical protein